jgi:hypothetical protein
VKKSEKPRFYGQNKLPFYYPALKSLGSLSHMAACRSSLENIGKMNLIPVLNKTSPQAHMVLELGMFVVPKKLLKFVVHSFQRFFLKKSYFSSHKVPKLESTSFWFQGI